MFSTDTFFFLNIFDSWLVESQGIEFKDTICTELALLHFQLKDPDYTTNVGGSLRVNKQRGDCGGRLARATHGVLRGIFSSVFTLKEERGE
jgi:hypothetical protein